MLAPDPASRSRDDRNPTLAQTTHRSSFHRPRPIRRRRRKRPSLCGIVESTLVCGCQRTRRELFIGALGAAAIRVERLRDGSTCHAAPHSSHLSRPSRRSRCSRPAHPPAQRVGSRSAAEGRHRARRRQVPAGAPHRIEQRGARPTCSDPPDLCLPDRPEQAWPDICYHFMIGPDGSVWETRAGSLAGPVVADATGGNQGFAQLVCLIGDFTAQPPTPAAQDSLLRMLIFLADRYDIDTDPAATTTFVSRGSDKFPAGTHDHDTDDLRASRRDVHRLSRRRWATRCSAAGAAGSTPPVCMRSDPGPIETRRPPEHASHLIPPGNLRRFVQSVHIRAAHFGAWGWSPCRTTGRSLAAVTAPDHPTTSRLHADVVVVGAGPAGTAAAIELRRAGRSVDRHRQGGVPARQVLRRRPDHARTARTRPPGARPGTIADWFDVRGAAIRSPSGREVVVALPTTGKYAAVAPRLQLDDALVQLAREHGADVRDGHGFERLVEHADHVTVFAEGLEIDTRYVVAADGMWSPVRKSTRRRTSPATSASGTASVSTAATSPARRPSSCTCGSSRTCCPATPGRSRSPTVGSTSASACCATAAARARR